VVFPTQFHGLCNCHVVAPAPTQAMAEQGAQQYSLSTPRSPRSPRSEDGTETKEQSTAATPLLVPKEQHLRDVARVQPDGEHTNPTVDRGVNEQAPSDTRFADDKSWIAPSSHPDENSDSACPTQAEHARRASPTRQKDPYGTGVLSTLGCCFLIIFLIFFVAMAFFLINESQLHQHDIELLHATLWDVKPSNAVRSGASFDLSISAQVSSTIERSEGEITELNADVESMPRGIAEDPFSSMSIGTAKLKAPVKWSGTQKIQAVPCSLEFHRSVHADIEDKLKGRLQTDCNLPSKGTKLKFKFHSYRVEGEHRQRNGFEKTIVADCKTLHKQLTWKMGVALGVNDTASSSSPVQSSMVFEVDSNGSLIDMTSQNEAKFRVVRRHTGHEESDT